MSRTTNPGRRRFLQVTLTVGGALLAQWRPLGAEPTSTALPLALLGDQLIAMGPFVQIERDGRVMLGAPGCEVGQGVRTSLPMLIAEELDVDWAQVSVLQLPYAAPASRSGFGRYGRQGGVTGDRLADWRFLREAGAAVRVALLEAAATEWQLPLAALRSERGEIVAEDGRRLPYAALAARAAARLPARSRPALKPAARFIIVGQPTRSVDAQDIVTGRAGFGIDAYAASGLVACVMRCPFAGGELAHFDDRASRQVAGVREVLSLRGPGSSADSDAMPAAGVAVIADSTWAALRGRERLTVRWSEPAQPAESSRSLAQSANELLADAGAGSPLRADGDVASVFARAARVLKARYETSTLAHAPMEPLGATLDLRADRALLIAALENPAQAAQILTRLSGLPLEAIEIRLPRAGGSFGRRLDSDFITESVLLARAVGKPLKLMWTRGDDLRHDHYRPASLHELSAAIDRRKRIGGWRHRCVAPPRPLRTPQGLEDSPGGCSLAADTFPAGHIADVELRFIPLATRMPLAPATETTSAASAFAVQSFLDEIAVALRRDALELRLELLGEPRELAADDAVDFASAGARLANVLRRCARRLGWGQQRSDGHGIGIACHGGGGAYVAHGFEISTRGDALRIHRAVCVADIGRIINPLGIEAELIRGSLSAISDALHGAIHLEQGAVRERDLDDYPLLRMREAPLATEVEIVDSPAAPALAPLHTLPSAAPALANAIYAGTTVRLRKLPLLPELLRLL